MNHDITNIRSAALSTLPIDADDIWQIAAAPMTGFDKLIDDPDVPESLRAVLCVTKGGVMKMHSPDAEDEPEPRLAERVLREAAEELRSLPARIEVTDEEFARVIRPLVAPAGVSVEVVEQVHVIDALMDGLASHVNNLAATPVQSLIEVRGMTKDRIAAFAQAASLYAKAKPWDWSFGETMMKIEPPPEDEALSYCVAIGELGNTVGLSFHADPSEMEAMNESPREYWARNDGTKWAILFGEADDMASGDAALWRIEKFAIAGRKLYPNVNGFVNMHTITRPTPRMLTTMEAVLRAYAGGSRKDQEQGEWTREVPTFDGPRTITLRDVQPQIHIVNKVTNDDGAEDSSFSEGPTLVFPRRAGSISPMEIALAGQENLPAALSEAVAALSARGPSWEAQKIAFRAAEEDSIRAQTRLCHEALGVDPDCCDALTMLAELESRGPAELASRLREAVAAGQRSLGNEFFEKHRGHFWGLLETRPYMRALGALAEALCRDECREEAAGVWQRMLELNPNDNQGVRCELLGELLRMLNARAASDLIRKFAEDGSAVWTWGEVLLALLQNDEKRAARTLPKAVRSNAVVVAFLIESAPLPKVLPQMYSPGQVSEAEITGATLLPAARAIPGAQAWIAARAPAEVRRLARISEQDDGPPVVEMPKPRRHFKKRKGR